MILFIDRFQHDDYKYQARLGYDWESNSYEKSYQK